MRRSLIVTIATVAVVVGMAAGCSDDKKPDAGLKTTSSTTSATTLTSTTTTSAPRVTSTTTTAPARTPAPPSSTTAPVTTATSAPTTTSPPTTAPPTTKGPTTTTPPSTGAASPARAASGLLAAWQANDRVAAARFATAAGVKTMFGIAKEPVQATGPCQQDGSMFSCPYFAQSGTSFFLRSSGSRGSGYRVIEVTTGVD